MVSIVIPTYNRADFLAQAVESVLAQTFRDWELVVVDDGSSDDTQQVLEGLRDPRIRCHRVDHGGVSRARNIGVRLTSRPWISFLDSDDRWQPRKLQRQLEALEERPEYRAVYTNEIWIRNGVRVNQKRKHRKYSGWIFQHCLPLCLISPSSILMERSLLEKIGVFDEAYPVCEDYELWLRLTSRYPVLFLDEGLIVKVGGHEDQLSKSRWGFDEFRVRALVKAYDSGMLSAQQRLWTAREVARKAGILTQGFQNRGKATEARAYEGEARLWSRRAEELAYSGR